MIIGVVGAGRIGGTIAGRLSAAGHEVRLANSRGPDTIRDLAHQLGATATDVRGAVDGADVVITSIPIVALPSLSSVLANAPAHAVVIDTSNYWPGKDGLIVELLQGPVESEWVDHRLGRPVVKAWNNILAGSFVTKASRPGSPGRIALAVAGDDAADKQIAMDLVDITGFDPVDSGPLSESWRQQPGAPAYCTDLSAGELRNALAAADRSLLAVRRDEMWSRMTQIEGTPTNDQLLALNRLIYA